MSSNIAFIHYFICIVYAVSFKVSYAETLSAELGAKVYYDRCILCHGARGMGEGILPLKLESYPNTNLLKNIKSVDRNDIRMAISEGGSKKNSKLSEYMPPMGEELNAQELNAVTDFVLFLRKDSDKALALVNKQTETEGVDINTGKDLFKTRCSLCHGNSGEGDGRMAKIIKSPPPANLVKSKMPSAYLAKIIELGGASMGRSAQMPPWGDQLNNVEIQSLVVYIESLREK